MIDYVTRGKVLFMILDSFQMEAYYWQCLLTKKNIFIWLRMLHTICILISYIYIFEKNS